MFRLVQGYSLIAWKVRMILSWIIRTKRLVSVVCLVFKYIHMGCSEQTCCVYVASRSVIAV